LHKNKSRKNEKVSMTSIVISFGSLKYQPVFFVFCLFLFISLY
jgi:hypothetical protein